MLDNPLRSGYDAVDGRENTVKVWTNGYGEQSAILQIGDAVRVTEPAKRGEKPFVWATTITAVRHDGYYMVADGMGPKWREQITLVNSDLPISLLVY